MAYFETRWHIFILIKELSLKAVRRAKTQEVGLVSVFVQVMQGVHRMDHR